MLTCLAALAHEYRDRLSLQIYSISHDLAGGMPKCSDMLLYGRLQA